MPVTPDTCYTDPAMEPILRYLLPTRLGYSNVKSLPIFVILFKGVQFCDEKLDQRKVLETLVQNLHVLPLICSDEAKSDYSSNWMVHSEQDSLRIHSYAVTQIFEV